MLESNSGVLNTAQEDAARIATLEGEIAQLRRRDAERSAELDARERRIRLLEEALRILQSNRFGSSREKLHVAPGQVAGPPRQRIILFDYDPSRGPDAAGRLLDGAFGIIQSRATVITPTITSRSNLT